MLIFLWSFVFIKTFLLIIMIYSEFRKSYTINKNLVDFLEGDFFIGEAKSHCVKQTMKDILTPAVVFQNIFN